VDPEKRENAERAHDDGEWEENIIDPFVDAGNMHLTTITLQGISPGRCALRSLALPAQVAPEDPLVGVLGRFLDCFAQLGDQSTDECVAVCPGRRRHHLPP
jgi:hypothetical protein